MAGDGSAPAAAAEDNGGGDPAAATVAGAAAGLHDSGGGGGGEYLRGLANVERHIEQLREDVLQLQSSHRAHVTESGAAAAERRLGAAVRFLRDRNLTIGRIDSEAGLLSLVNDLRATGADEALVRYASDYRDAFPDAMAVVRRAADRYDALVRQRLNLLASSSAAVDHRGGGGGARHRGDSPAAAYSASLSGALVDINKLYDRLQLLLRSYERYGVNPKLLDAAAVAPPSAAEAPAAAAVTAASTSPSSPPPLSSSPSPAAAFAVELHIVQLPRDAANKLWQLLAKAEACVAKDKQFVVDIENYIRLRREEARERELTLKKEKQHQLQLLKQFTLANMMLQKNKQRLKKVEEELGQIEAEIQAHEQRRAAAQREKVHKESAIEFLKIGITQTRKNYSLQLKRARVVRQLKELELALSGVEKELEALYEQIGTKSERRRELAVELRNSEQSYNSLKVDLERLTRSIATLEPQVHEIAEQLSRLEALQLVKTSPEMAENFLDRPTSVKLAPSLQEKIERKRKRLV